MRSRIFLFVLCAAVVAQSGSTSAATPDHVKTAPLEVLDTTNQTGAMAPSDLSLRPNWPHKATAYLPSALDWRNHNGNYVSGIRDQLTCGSCWDFAAVALLESMSMIHLARPGTDPDFSEQYVLSCITGGSDCVSGYTSAACDFLVNSGTPLETCFEYEHDDTVPCSDVCSGFADQLHRLGVWYWVTTTTYDPEAIKQALQYGPLVTWMQINTDFEDFPGGRIYSGYGASYTGENHSVLLIGYDDANQCWIAKNSYGTRWGDNGYFRVAYDNACWFGLWTIAGAYESPATNITLSWTLGDAQAAYSDYDLRVRVYSDLGQLLTDVPFEVSTSCGTVIEQDPTTGGFGIGWATVRAQSSGPCVVAVTALNQVASLTTTTQVGSLSPLEPHAAIAEAGAMPASAVAWSPDGNLLAIAAHNSSQGMIRIFDVNTMALVRSFAMNSRSCGLDFSPDGAQLVVALTSSIVIVDASTGAILRSTSAVDGNPGDSRSTFWVAANKIVTPQITSSTDAACVLNGSLNLLSSLPVVSFKTMGASVAADVLYVCVPADEVRCYRLSTYSLLNTFALQDPFSAAINPAGTRLAIAQDNDDIRVYTVPGWQLSSTITGAFTDEMAFMDWSSDGVTFAGIDEDGYFWAFNYDSAANNGHVLGKRLVGGDAMNGMVTWHPGGGVVACLSPGIGVQLFSPRDTANPVLALTRPATGEVTTDNAIVVAGTAADGRGMRCVTVSCGAWTSVDYELDDGFEFVVPLAPYANVITVRAVDASLRVTERVVTVNRGVADVVDTQRRGFQVYECWPNPANPRTTIAFEVPGPRPVDVTIYDVAGRLVRSLARGFFAGAGRNEMQWDGMDDRGHLVGSGSYLVRVMAGSEAASTRLLLLR